MRLKATQCSKFTQSWIIKPMQNLVHKVSSANITLAGQGYNHPRFAIDLVAIQQATQNRFQKSVSCRVGKNHDIFGKSKEIGFLKFKLDFFLFKSDHNLYYNFQFSV